MLRSLPLAKKDESGASKTAEWGETDVRMGQKKNSSTTGKEERENAHA